MVISSFLLRREYVAILASIPKNIKEADLFEIANQVNAKALNVPLSINSYKPKPYAYLNFSSFDTLEAVKEMTVAFHGKGNNNNNIPNNNGYSSGSIQPPPEPRPNNSTTHISSSDNSAYTLLQHIIDDGNPGDSDLYPPHDDQETHSYNNGWDDAPTQDTNSGFNLLPHTAPSLIDTSPDASFSTLDPNSVLSRRHVPLLNSRPTIIAPDANAFRLQLEISNVTNTQKNLSAQLGTSPP
ncbi:hypothetical protein GLOIN_2v1785090 [Rhizophagus irregularis DAOM 181602=DAOM 197198]|nr:hypothetical protein GLOIN_2v1785090 [Rhizophagus irregularis DAOM 181602=DAOM 197198]